MSDINREDIQRIINEIDELLALRQGFNEAYRDWREKVLEECKPPSAKSGLTEFDRLGPRQTPVNRQHRVHIYRQRLHAQRKYLTDLLESRVSSGRPPLAAGSAANRRQTPEGPGRHRRQGPHVTCVAEGEGFEPSVGLLILLRFSKPPGSATLAPFRADRRRRPRLLKAPLF